MLVPRVRSFQRVRVRLRGADSFPNAFYCAPVAAAIAARCEAAVAAVRTYSRRAAAAPVLLKFGAECSICMGPIDVVTGAYMVTPCDHLFHEICLSQWMDLKMECPVCRASLPPVGGDGEEADDSSGSESPPRNGPRDPLLNP